MKVGSNSLFPDNLPYGQNLSTSAGGQSFFSSERPAAELGISQNVPLEISDFFTLRFFAQKTGTNLYTVNFEVLDLNGTVLNSMELVDQPLDGTLNSNQLALKFGHLGDFTWRVHDNIRFDNFRYQLTSATETSLSPTALNVTRGQGVNTDVNRLANNDNVDVSIQRSNSDIQSRTEFEFGLISPVTIPSLLEVTIDGSVFARSTVTQTLEIFNNATQSWDIIDRRDASRLVDTTITVPLAGDLSRFVANQTNEIQARIRFQSNQNRQRFSSNTDQILFRIGY